MCVGCLISEKEYQERIIKVQKEAKAYAITHKKLVVIILSPTGEPGFMEHETAERYGLRWIQYISYMQPATDG